MKGLLTSFDTKLWASDAAGLGAQEPKSFRILIVGIFEL